MADPVTIGAAARYVYGAFSLLGGGGRLSEADRRAVAATGLTPYRGVFRGAGGVAVSQAEAINRGRVILASQAAIPTAPVPSFPAPPVYQTPEGLLREVLTKRPTFTPSGGTVFRPPTLFEELLAKRPTFTPRGGTIADAAPRAAARGAISVLARGAGLLGALLWPTATADSDLGYKRRPGGKPPRPPKGPKRRFRRLPKDPTRLFRRIPDDWPTRADPRRPDTPRIPLESWSAPAPLSRPIGQPGARPATRPRIQPQPVQRGQPRGVPSSTAIPSASTRGMPARLALPFPFVSPFQQPRPGRTPDRLSPLLPGQPIGNPYGNPLTDRLTEVRPLARPLTRPQPQPLSSPLGEPPCSCSPGRSSKPKRKRKPRSVCYRGSFTETRSSTLKQRKEQIPCR